MLTEKSRPLTESEAESFRVRATQLREQVGPSKIQGVIVLACVLIIYVPICVWGKAFYGLAIPVIGALYFWAKFAGARHKAEQASTWETLPNTGQVVESHVASSRCMFAYDNANEIHYYFFDLEDRGVAAIRFESPPENGFPTDDFTVIRFLQSDFIEDEMNVVCAGVHLEPEAKFEAGEDVFSFSDFEIIPKSFEEMKNELAALHSPGR